MNDKEQYTTKATHKTKEHLRHPSFPYNLKYSLLINTLTSIFFFFIHSFHSIIACEKDRIYQITRYDKVTYIITYFHNVKLLKITKEKSMSSEVQLFQNERIDQLFSEDIQIIQSREVFSFSLDAVLLANFPNIPKRGKIVDMCASREKIISRN